MPIARRPLTPPSRGVVDIDELIHRGGEPANGNGHESTKARKPESQQAVIPVILRIPRETLRAIDAEVDARVVRTPRHTWLLEAIAEKLEKGRG